jgi:hypothetical protein
MSDTWEEWSKHILSELKRGNIGHEEIRKEMALMDRRIQDRFYQMQSEIVSLKVKAGIWGVMGGSIPVFIIIIIEFLKAPK